MDDLESGETGALLDEAVELIKAFVDKKVKLYPIVEGYFIFRRGHGLLSKKSKRYFQLIANQGVLIKFLDLDHCLEIKKKQ